MLVNKTLLGFLFFSFFFFVKDMNGAQEGYMHM